MPQTLWNLKEANHSGRQSPLRENLWSPRTRMGRLVELEAYEVKP